MGAMARTIFDENTINAKDLPPYCEIPNFTLSKCKLSYWQDKIINYIESDWDTSSRQFAIIQEHFLRGRVVSMCQFFKYESLNSEYECKNVRSQL